jgi:hypothetical protein
VFWVMCHDPQAVQEEMRQHFKPENLEEFAIRGSDADFEEALASRSAPTTGLVSVKGSGKRPAAAEKPKKNEVGGAQLYKKNSKGQKRKAGRESGGGGKPGGGKLRTK